MREPSKVLIIDDHPRMVSLIQRWLVRAGYHATGATTVQEALEALSTHTPAWVITDLMLPTGDGMAILVHARSHYPQAKVVIMTAFGSEAMRQRALSQGAHGFLSKPFSSKDLLAILTQEPPSDPTRATADGDQPTS
jgi:DNA-binding NtrC family response regulator